MIDQATMTGITTAKSMAHGFAKPVRATVKEDRVEFESPCGGYVAAVLVSDSSDPAAVAAEGVMAVVRAIVAKATT